MTLFIIIKAPCCGNIDRTKICGGVVLSRGAGPFEECVIENESRIMQGLRIRVEN